MTDEISIRLSGGGAQTILTGWQKVQITTGIERVPPSFELTYTEPLPGDALSVAARGMACVLSIGSDPVITGYVDRVIDRMTATEHVLTLSGRGMSEDLVDCAAVWQGAVFNNVTALDMGTKLGSPYGVVVVTDESDLVRLPQIIVNLGETAFEAIDRVCKLSGLLAFEQPNGTLLLTRVGTAQAASGFQQGMNVQEASIDNSMDQRFSDYTIVYPGNQVFGDIGDAPLTTYSYQDTGVPRYRQKYVELLSNSLGVAGSGVESGIDLTKQQAMWEMNRRIGRSQVVRVTADSWRDSGGTLWTPNTLADVKLPALKVPKTQLLIGEITFKLGLDTGTTVEVELMPPAAFDIEPISYLPIAGDVVAANDAILSKATVGQSKP